MAGGGGAVFRSFASDIANAFANTFASAFAMRHLREENEGNDTSTQVSSHCCRSACFRCAGLRQAAPLGLVGLSGVLFAIQSSCLKIVHAHGFGALEFVAVRGLTQFVLTAASFLLLHARGTHPLPVRHWLGVTCSQRLWLLLRACMGFGGIAFYMLSLERLPMGDASALGFVAPIVSTSVAWLTMGEQCPGRTEMGALFGTIVGIVFVARPPALFGDHATGSADAAGVAFALASALTAGLALVLIRKLAKSLHWTVVLIYQAMGQAVFAGLAMPLVGRAWRAPDSLNLLVMVLGGSAAFLAQISLTVGLSTERVGPASAMRSVNVLAAFCFQFVITPYEPVQPLSVFGSLIITGSIVAVMLRRVRQQSGTHIAGRPAASTKVVPATGRVPEAGGDDNNGASLGHSDDGVKSDALVKDAPQMSQIELIPEVHISENKLG